MIPYASIISYAALGAACAWGGWSVQSWRLGEQIQSLKTEYATAQARAVERAHSETIRLQQQKDTAERMARQRQSTLAADAVGVRDALFGLSDAADQALRSSQDSLGSCTNNATVITDLLKSCSARYESVAKQADGWEIEALTLRDAWPSGTAVIQD